MTSKLTLIMILNKAGRAFLARPLLVGFCSWLFSLTLWAPSLALYLSQGGARRADLLLQCQNLFRRDLYEPILYYRLLQPALAKLLGLCSPDQSSIRALLGSPGLSFLASIVTLSIVYVCISKKTSAVAGLLTTLMLGTSQVVQWSNNTWGAPDSFTLACVAGLLITKSSLIITTLILVGGLADERIALSIPVILLFRWYFMRDKPSDKLLPNLKVILNVEAITKAIPWLAGVALLILFRLFIKHGVIGPGIEIPEYGSNFQLFSGLAGRLLRPSEWPDLLWMYAQGYRWAWLIVIAYLLTLTRNPKELIAALASLSIVLIPIIIVADVARSTAYVYPILLIAILELHRLLGNRTFCFSILILLVLNCLTPAGYSFGGLNSKFYWYYPLPVRIWRWIIFPGGPNQFVLRLG